MSGTEDLGPLLRRYHDVGDETAIGELVRRTRPRLLRVARRIGSPQDAEDSVQSAYLALARKRGEPFDAPVLGWLITAVVRIAYRRKAIEKRQHDLVSSLSTERQAPSAAADAIGAEERERIRRDVGRLPAKYRDAIVLHHLEGLTMAEVGRLQELPEATVRTRVRRGRDLLRGRLHFVWNGMLAVVWLLQDARRPIAGGYLMKKNTVVVGALLLLALGTGAIGLGAFGTKPHGMERAEQLEEAKARTAATPATAGPEDGTPAIPEARVTGIVLDESGRPVEGARVGSMAKDGRVPTRRTRSDAGGHFAVALEAEAPWHRLWVEADGFSPALVEPVRDGSDVRVTLDPMSTLSGIVADLDGNPVAGAHVTWSVHGMSIRLERAAVSDNRGAFTITGLPSPWNPIANTLAGYAASLLVTADGFATLITQAEVPSPRTGRELRKDLYLGRGATVRGRVLDGPTGRPLPGVHVVLGSMPRAPLEYRYGEEVTGEDGAFEMIGVPGDAFHQVLGYGSGSDRKLAVLRAGKEGYATATADVPVAREGEAVEVELRCWPTGVVRGRVVDAGGKSLARAAINAISMVQTRRSLWDAGDSRVQTTTGDDGRYELAAPGPGFLRISAHLKGRSAQLIDVDVQPGVATDAPEIVLDEPHPSAIVEVVDEANKPVWGANVSLRPPGGFYKTGRDGRVRVFRKDGGEVRALASSFDSGERWSNPFVLGENDAVVRITLDATKTIRGFVLLADGSPAPGARVDASAESGGSITGADRKGAFELRRLADGSYRVSAHYWNLSGQYVTSTARDIRSGGREVVVTLPGFEKSGAITVTGRVRDRRTQKPIGIFSAMLGNGKRFLNAERMPGGRFSIRGVSPGHWSLFVSATGYESYNAKIEARLGTTSEPLEVLLGEGTQLRGRVTASAGIDLAGAIFMLERDDGFKSGAYSLAANGSYTLESVPPGRYRPIVFVPADLAAATDATVVVAPGASRVKFDFRAVKGGWISATLPAGAREIRYLDASGETIWTRTGLGKRKSVAAKLPAGSYAVQLLREQGEPLERTCTVEEGGNAALSFDDP